jgi:probable addiction module antidote protein
MLTQGIAFLHAFMSAASSIMHPFFLAREVDQGYDQNDDKQHHSFRGSVAEFILNEALLVDFIDHGCVLDCCRAHHHDIDAAEYLEYGNLNAFVRSLEYVVRAKDNISNLSRKTGISRSNLYAIFNGEVTPQFDTVLKMLKELGYTLKVA